MQHYKTIVVGTDLSPTAESAIEAAAKLAEPLGATDVHLVHVVTMTPAYSVAPYALDEAEMNRLQAHAREVASHRLESRHRLPMGQAKVHRHVRFGIPARELATAADELHADLVVIATHGHGALGRALLGSVASSVIRVVHCPVLVVAPDRLLSPDQGAVLTAVDMSPPSKGILEHAAAFARLLRSKLWVASYYEQPVVLPTDGGFLPRYVAPDELENLAESYKASVEKLVQEVRPAGVEAELEVSARAPASMCILERAKVLNPGLIVIGTSGRNAWKRMLLGSTATKVVAEAGCPVLVVPFDAERSR